MLTTITTTNTTKKHHQQPQQQPQPHHNNDLHHHNSTTSNPILIHSLNLSQFFSTPILPYSYSRRECHGDQCIATTHHSCFPRQQQKQQQQQDQQQQSSLLPSQPSVQPFVGPRQHHHEHLYKSILLFLPYN